MATAADLIIALNALTAALQALTAEMTDKCVESFEEPSPPPTFEQVRGKLTELSRAGHSTEVRALLQKHGAQKLSEVPESDYARLLYDAEAIGNAS